VAIFYNILKGINVLVIVYIDTKHRGLEQCNGRAPLTTKSWKDCRGWGCLFYWDACGIEGMVREKMVSSSFGGATGPELQTPSANKPLVSARQVGLQTHGVGAALDKRARPACMATDLGERV
jgi:hypothetical protein